MSDAHSAMPIQVRTRTDLEEEIARRVAAERPRVEQLAGLLVM